MPAELQPGVPPPHPSLFPYDRAVRRPHQQLEPREISYSQSIIYAKTKALVKGKKGFPHKTCTGNPPLPLSSKSLRQPMCLELVWASELQAGWMPAEVEIGFSRNRQPPISHPTHSPPERLSPLARADWDLGVAYEACWEVA